MSPTPPSVQRKLVLAAAVAILAAASACSDDAPAEAGSSQARTVTASATVEDAPDSTTGTTAGTPAATATDATADGTASAPPSDTTPAAAEASGAAGVAAAAPALTPPPEPEVARAMDHIRHLSVEIGERPAGSEEEREAASYIADQLTEAGWDAEIEEFTFASQQDHSAVTTPDGDALRALAIAGSPSGEASGTAVHGGLGRPEDLAGADLDGKVVIFDRGVVTFGDKARAAEAGGAVAVIVVNDEPGLFRGALGDVTVSIPVVGVAAEDHEALEDAIGRRVTVLSDAGMDDVTSQNVVAKIGNGECRAYLGAHYDSVAVSPGANDNASGTAVVLEVARTNPVEGLCVVLFGAEELGLYGSQNYVADHLAGTGRFMINVDMAGRLDGPNIVGDAALTDAILDGIEDAGVDSPLRPGSFPPFASSDHVSFEAVGVPAVTFNSGEDAAIHTADDTIDRIQEDAVAMFLGSVDAALDALVEEHADALAR